jgi:hypothetical protein
VAVRGRRHLRRGGGEGGARTGGHGAVGVPSSFRPDRVVLLAVACEGYKPTQRVAECQRTCCARAGPRGGGTQRGGRMGKQAGWETPNGGGRFCPSRRAAPPLCRCAERVCRPQGADALGCGAFCAGAVRCAPGGGRHNKSSPTLLVPSQQQPRRAHPLRGVRRAQLGAYQGEGGGEEGRAEGCGPGGRHGAGGGVASSNLLVLDPTPRHAPWQGPTHGATHGAPCMRLHVTGDHCSQKREQCSRVHARTSSETHSWSLPPLPMAGLSRTRRRSLLHCAQTALQRAPAA